MSKLVQVTNGEYIGANKYTIKDAGGGKSTVDFAPDSVIKEGTPVGAELLNEIQKNSIPSLEAVRRIEGQDEVYDCQVEGIDTFVFDKINFIVNFDLTNTKTTPFLRIGLLKYPIKFLEKTLNLGDLDSGNRVLLVLDKAKQIANIVSFLSDNKNKANVVATIEELKSSTRYKVGDIVEVLGYYAKGDGANHKRKISETDDGSGVQLSNGLWANIVHNGEVDVSWFGAKGDGVTDDAVAIQKAINIANIVAFEGHTFLCKGSLNIKPRLTLKGQFEKTRIDIKNDTDFIHHIDKIYSVLIQNIEFRKISGNGCCIKLFDSDINVGTHLPQVLEIRDCNFKGFKGTTTFKNGETNLASAIYYYGGLECSFYNCSFGDNNIGIYLHEQQQPRVNLCNFSGSRLADILIQGGHNASVQENDFVSLNVANRVVNWKVPDANYTVDGSHLVIFGSESTNILGNKIKQEYNIVSKFNVNININKNYIIFNKYVIKSENDTNINITDNYISSYNNATGNYLDLSNSTNVNILNNCFEYSSLSTYDFLIKIQNRYSNVNIDNNAFGTRKTVNNVLVKTIIELTSSYRGFLNVSNNSFATGGNVIVEKIFNGADEIAGSSFVGNSFYTTGTSEIRDRNFPLFQQGFIFNENGVSFSLNKAGSAYLKSATSYTTELTSDLVLPAGGTQFLTLTVSGGITPNDTLCNANMSLNQANISVTANIYSTNRISITFSNNHTGSLTIPSGTKIYIFALSYNNINLITATSETHAKNNIEYLDTPYMTTKMQQDGVYEDFVSYMDSKLDYDNAQRELESQKQQAFAEGGMENYEEWLATQPMALSMELEPVPSERLMEFKIKYLG